MRPRWSTGSALRLVVAAARGPQGGQPCQRQCGGPSLRPFRQATPGTAASLTRYGADFMIIVVAALKGGVGKTTTAVYLSALAAASRDTTLVDADPQGSAADWLLNTEDAKLDGVELVEAPTERLLSRALDRLGDDDVAVVDTPPGHDRLLAKALDYADVVVLPTRVGGVEAPRVDAVLAMIPRDIPVGLVICSARTYTATTRTWSTRGAAAWSGCGARCPSGSRSPRAPWPAWPTDGLEAYRPVWRRARARGSRRVAVGGPRLRENGFARSSQGLAVTQEVAGGVVQPENPPKRGRRARLTPPATSAAQARTSSPRTGVTPPIGVSDDRADVGRGWGAEYRGLGKSGRAPAVTSAEWVVSGRAMGVQVSPPSTDLSNVVSAHAVDGAGRARSPERR